MKAFPVGMLAVALGLAPLAAEARPIRIMSLDQCADQYVLALAPDAELLLSPRADDPDSWARAQARGRPSARPTLEAAVGFQPDVVVRYWGGEPRLLAALQHRKIRVASIDDAVDMDGVRRNIRQVAHALDQTNRGEALVAAMDDRLDAARRLSQVQAGPRGAVYLTTGGFTAGPGTLVDAIFKEAGYLNLTTSPGFQALSVETLIMTPPARFVLGFFDQVRADWRGAGRHPVVRRLSRGRTAARLSGDALTCPAWFAADASWRLARGVG